MIFSREGNTVILTQERATIPELVVKIHDSYDKLKHNNLIVNLSSLGEISKGALDEFLQVSKTHQSGNQSFILVTSNVALDDVSENIVVVPTLQEAHDIIEMEDMERDLGI